MPVRALNPYLNFDGTASKAIALYEKALGAKAENVMRFGDMPGPGGQAVPPAMKDRVLHARLRIGEGVLMLSDTQPGRPVRPGDHAHVSLDYTDAQEMQRAFDALAQGGKVTMPLGDTFWGAKFGMLTDAFGISWMFNCEKKK
jgi:PhnB protein